jgi:RNA polymerase sigma-70 factor (ECF subfamily)
MQSGDAATPHESPSITDYLVQLRAGNREALDQLLPLVYVQLRRLAHRQLLNERTGHTLDTAGLVHETYLKLVDITRVEWQDRAHFFAVAAQAMRRILVDYARRHRAERRGGGLRPATLGDETMVAERGETLLALDEALERLAAFSQRLSQVVECRYFAGLTEEETAEALGVTTRTVQRDWAKARGWLYLQLREGNS